MEMMVAVVLASVLLCCFALCAFFASSGKGVRTAPNNAGDDDANSEVADEGPLLSANALVVRARRLKTSRDRRERLATSSGKDLSRYFKTDADTFLNRQLRGAGIRPEDVDLPPAIAGLEEEILAPPPGANERNEGFFARNNRA